MKSFIVFAAFFAIAAAGVLPGNPDADATIVSQTADITPEGNFQAAFETSNGIAAQEQGTLKQNTLAKSAEDPSHFVAVQGQFSYTGPDGVVYTVRYVADENGFQPEAAHLPVAPVA